MKLRPRRSQPPDINLTPLLDVVFLLLIFFMVSTTFKDATGRDETRLRVQLPQAQGAEAPAKDPDHIRIVIDQAGSFFVDDRAVVDQQGVTLVRAINGALGERKGVGVLIQADAKNPHQAVMTVLDAAAELGLVKVAFAAMRTGPESAAPGKGQ
jgi:biopolymer transport protein ExbD